MATERPGGRHVATGGTTLAGSGSGPPAAPDAGTARTEALVGLLLVGLVLLAALWFRSHPAAVFLDRWGTWLFPPDPSGSAWRDIADLKMLPIFIGGSILAAAFVVRRDPRRALACLVAPSVAVLLAEYLIKPLIARRFGGALFFPSGTTTAVGSLAMAWAIAVPRPLRTPVAAVGAVLAGLECAAVTALQWHLPTDALGGVLLGVGTVLVFDGVLHVRHAPRGA